MSSIAIGLSCVGFILLSLSMKRHFHQVWPGSRNFAHWSLRSRIGGYGCIALALIPCILQSGLWIGLVLWISILAGATFLQTMLLTWWPQCSLLFGSASLVLVVVGLLL